MQFIWYTEEVEVPKIGVKLSKEQLTLIDREAKELEKITDRLFKSLYGISMKEAEELVKVAFYKEIYG